MITTTHHKHFSVHGFCLGESQILGVFSSFDDCLPLVKEAIESGFCVVTVKQTGPMGTIEVFNSRDTDIFGGW